MKGILIVQKPRDCENIISGKKTVIAYKKMPKLQTPFKGYIFCTKGKPFIQKIRFGDIAISHTQISKKIYNGRVIGEFICDEVEEFSVGSLRSDDIEKLACLSYSEMINYFYKPEELDGKTGKYGYGLYISQLKIYNTPKELSEFSRPCSYNGLCSSCKRFKANGSSYDICNSAITRQPQSWCYVEELEDAPNVFRNLRI